MLKSIRNIIFLLLICATASGLPIYVDSFNFTPAVIISTTGSRIKITSSLDKLHNNNYNLTLSFTSEEPITVELHPETPIVVQLLMEENVIKELAVDDIIEGPLPNEFVVSKDSPFDFVINLTQQKLNLPDGSYTIKVIPNLLNLQVEEKYFANHIEFRNEYTYLPALRGINRGETALTLFFPDNQFNNMIPITRVIPYTNTPLRATINHLLSGADAELGLPIGPHIPSNVGLDLNRGIAGVFIRGDLEEFESNSSSASVAYNSFVKSLTSISGVNKVQFYFNNRIVDDAFHGKSVREPQAPHAGIRIYVGTVTETNRLLLTPIPVYTEDIGVQEIFNMLKFSTNPQLYSKKLLPPVSEEVELLSYSITNHTLTLTFNNHLLEGFREDMDRQKFMLDALLFTYSTLPNINEVVFVVNGETLSNMNGLIIPTNTNHLYINPEK